MNLLQCESGHFYWYFLFTVPYIYSYTYPKFTNSQIDYATQLIPYSYLIPRLIMLPILIPYSYLICYFDPLYLPPSKENCPQFHAAALKREAITTQSRNSKSRRCLGKSLPSAVPRWWLGLDHSCGLPRWRHPCPSRWLLAFRHPLLSSEVPYMLDAA